MLLLQNVFHQQASNSRLSLQHQFWVVELFSLFQVEPMPAETNAAQQEEMLKDLLSPCHHSPIDDTDNYPAKQCKTMCS